MYCNSWTFTRLPAEIYEKTQKQKIKNKNQIKKDSEFVCGICDSWEFLGNEIMLFLFRVSA